MALPTRPFNQKQKGKYNHEKEGPTQKMSYHPWCCDYLLFLVIAMSYAFDPANLQKLKTKNSRPECYLSGVNLSESHLNNAS